MTGNGAGVSVQKLQVPNTKGIKMTGLCLQKTGIKELCVRLHLLAGRLPVNRQEKKCAPILFCQHLYGLIFFKNQISLKGYKIYRWLKSHFCKYHYKNIVIT